MRKVVKMKRSEPVYVVNTEYDNGYDELIPNVCVAYMQPMYSRV